MTKVACNTCVEVNAVLNKTRYTWTVAYCDDPKKRTEIYEEHPEKSGYAEKTASSVVDGIKFENVSVVAAMGTEAHSEPKGSTDMVKEREWTGKVKVVSEKETVCMLGKPNNKGPSVKVLEDAAVKEKEKSVEPEEKTKLPDECSCPSVDSQPPPYKGASTNH